jgi:hypothetical protein
MEEQEKNTPSCSCNCGGPPGPPKPASCEDKPFPFSKEELLLFEEQRRVRKEADRIKKKLKEIPAEQEEEKKSLQARLDRLRGEWDTLKEKSEQARKERMIALNLLEEGPMK